MLREEIICYSRNLLEGFRVPQNGNH